MRIEQTRGIVRRFPVRIATAPRPTPTTAYRAPFVSAPGSYFNSVSTPSVVRFASLSPTRPTAIPQFEPSSVPSRFGKLLGGIVRQGVRAAVGLVPGGGTALSVYDSYNTSHDRVGAFSPDAPVSGRVGGGVVKGGGPPPLSALPGQVLQPGTSVVPSGGGAMEGATSGVFQTPDGQWHTKTWRSGSHGHMTKGTRRNPSHWTNRRRPRMNPMNVHAGRRALRRIHSAEKLFHRFLAVSHPGHVGHVKPKFKRGKR